MNPIKERLFQCGIVPVVVIEDAKDAGRLGEALLKGGLPVAEVTFRTEAAAESIRILSESFPELLVGAGTVLSAEQADRAIQAGAQFIVSPGLNPNVTGYVLEQGIPMVPGIMTPSEIEAAMEFGLDVVKFFPAEPAGGLRMIEAMAAPYGSIRFMPTGDINETNVKDYLSSKKVLACGGSWMVKSALIREGRFDEIEAKVRAAAGIVSSVRG
ncbi:MAG: bifunctional 4-hydroxy-2-oxoglutarate aldolase/2-dehydro-3-deoxy-phosphogluconate aldolase [Lachnospiraceae bacterium]|nr:bifunctional 4-hydroxy-2-oxoglutarate aldolase/2-dehydro-3-deoxy-phosphogluconate aldolase [Lachnospiraceae bacterium]